MDICTVLVMDMASLRTWARRVQNKHLNNSWSNMIHLKLKCSKYHPSCLSKDILSIWQIVRSLNCLRSMELLKQLLFDESRIQVLSTMRLLNREARLSKDWMDSSLTMETYWLLISRLKLCQVLKQLSSSINYLKTPMILNLESSLENYGGNRKFYHTR